MTQQGFTRKSLGRAVGRNERLIYDLLGGTDDPRVETLQAVAETLGMTLGELRDGVADGVQSIPMLGATTAGGAWSPSVRHSGAVDLALAGGDAVAVQVHGDDLAPAYRSGDILIGPRSISRFIDNLVGLDCIVQTIDGERYVSKLMPGRVAGRYRLSPVNAADGPAIVAQIAWAAPIVWIRRGGL